jgi:hypothetical protein
VSVFREGGAPTCGIVFRQSLLLQVTIQSLPLTMCGSAKKLTVKQLLLLGKMTQTRIGCLLDSLINTVRISNSQTSSRRQRLIYALIGFLVMLGVMVGIGINQPRGTSIKTWCYGYLAISVVFDILVVFALLYQIDWLTELLLGLSAGAATGLAIHVAHHISEFGEQNEEGKDKPKGIFGF